MHPKWEVAQSILSVMVAFFRRQLYELILGSVLALPKVGLHAQDQPRTPVLSFCGTIFPKDRLEVTAFIFHSLSLVT